MQAVFSGRIVLLCLRTVFLAGDTNPVSGNCMPCLEEQIDVKSSIDGNKNDIKWFGKILQRNPKIEVTEFSDLYPNKGTKKFHRAYVEVRKSNVKENQ